MPKQTRAQRNRCGDLGHVEVEEKSIDDEKEELSDGSPAKLPFKWDILDEKLADLKEGLATKECIDALRKIIEGQNEKIEILEAKIVLMENYTKRLEANEARTVEQAKKIEELEQRTEELEQRSDDVEQYQRRLCLRFYGVELEGADGMRESGEKCLEKVKKMIKDDLKVTVPAQVFDRAHRIGAVREDPATKKKYQPVIVRFTTWQHRTQVYRARKSTKKFQVRLDLTRKRAKLLGRANEQLKARAGCYALADVNCRLSVKLEDGYHFFDTEDELFDLLTGDQ